MKQRVKPFTPCPNNVRCNTLTLNLFEVELCRIWCGAWHNITLLQQSDNRLARYSTALRFSGMIKNIIHFFFSINSLADRDLSLSEGCLVELLPRMHFKWHHLLQCLFVYVDVVTSLVERQRNSLFHPFSAWGWAK